jgi:hypothetical protein
MYVSFSYTVVFVGLRVRGVLFVFPWPDLKYKFCWYRSVYWVVCWNFWMILGVVFCVFLRIV